MTTAAGFAGQPYDQQPSTPGTNAVPAALPPYGYVWWLLECGHYGRSQRSNTIAEASGQARIEAMCEVCHKMRARVKRVEESYG